MAEYALGEIVIGYAQGDNPNYVTQNLTLPAKIYSADISWESSNPAVISPSGTVTRPNGYDSDVTLTATAICGEESASRVFTVKVIHAHTRVSSDVEIIGVQDAGSGDLSVTYSASGDVILDIEGNYSAITIQNADDALDAVQAIHESLGISNPYEELATFLTASDDTGDTGAEYSFTQTHKGSKVFGRGVVASANASGEGDFLHSSFLPSEVLESADLKINIDASEAESLAISLYSGDFAADTARTERVIYSLDGYENSPVYAYIVRVCGISGDEYIDDNVFVNADNGEIIMQYPNTRDAWDIRKASGRNEFGRDVSFDVVHGFSLETVSGLPTYMMIDPTLHLKVYTGIRLPILRQSWLVLSGPLIESLSNTWTDVQAVTAYSTMREIMQWWKDKFSRDSLDGRGSDVNIAVHASIKPKDNAGWNHDSRTMEIYDKPAVSSFDHFMGAATDLLTHESEHGVFSFIVGEFPYKNATGAINEGYADIFACIKDENWQIGEQLFDATNHYECMRDIAVLSGDTILNKVRLYDLDTIYTYYKTSKANKDSDYNLVHYNSHIVSHPAYAMHRDYDPVNGLTWNELAKVWYKSMHMGLSASSKFEDVRRCVLWAAQKTGLPANKITAIKSAFDKAGIKDSPLYGTLRGNVKDYDTGGNLQGVNVAVFDRRIVRGAYIDKIAGRKSTNQAGRYSFSLEAGNYPVVMVKNGYVGFAGFAEILQSGDTALDVRLVKPGAGSLSGTIYGRDNSQLQGAMVSLRKGWNVKDTSATHTATTDSNGQYSFDLGDNGAGYYTVEVRRAGYETAYFNVTVSGNTTGQDFHMSEGRNSQHDISQIDAEIDINALTSDSSGNGWTFSEGTLTLTDNLVYKVNGTSTATKNHITVKSGVNATAILDNVNIDVSETDTACAFDATSADVELFIQGNNYLRSGSGRAGLEVPDGSRLTINTIDGSDNHTLTAETNSSGHAAGIGGPGYGYSSRGRAGTMIIYSGTITASGGDGGAGIGGGDSTGPDGGGLIIIYGGNITATGRLIRGGTGAGIGSGYHASGRYKTVNDDGTRIFILGGTIKAVSEKDGAGIGGGYYSDSGVIRILDGLQSSITAKGGANAQDIGHGQDARISDVEYVDAVTLEAMIAEALAENDAPNDSQALPASVGVAETLPAMSEETHSPEILAVLPPFMPSTTGTYTFTASLDHMPNEGARLILLSDSEDLNASFAFTESADAVRVSADFNAGRLYSPIVAAEYDSHSQGGCMAVNLGALILFAGIILAGVKKS